ncbi:MAG: hypothetical protein J7545_08815 [Roseofilum sp. SBFL]|nr:MULTISPECIES: hypothetical protein [unclassified Roseofilum]MBP0014961.1 hypothetical protein [Roseofilum sp. SID3]MBP0026319.1 hypothetical protein [Roseofilum sp. SID2]MBP0036323.1 hypothetical protein [Roseofilum sp. SID1]MBP0042058.1 hypothetical protein [Roseofilum sp. SBFL]
MSNLGLTEVPEAIAQLTHLQGLELDNNPLNLELSASYEQGLDWYKCVL